MSVSLASLLVEAAVPLYAIPRRHWSGAVFVGSAARRREPEPRLGTVQVVYLDDDVPPTRGFAVTTVDPRAVADDPDPDPLDLHLTTFVTRFDQAFLMKRLKPRRFRPFPRSDFRFDTTTAALAGRTVGVEVYRHRELPLELARAAVRDAGGTVEVGVAAWRDRALDLVPLVEPVTPALAAEIDQPNGGPSAPE